GSTKAFLNFLWIANGSLSELETQLVLAVELGFVSHEDARTAFGLSNEVGRMLTGLRRSLS
ncbi:MAG TPA: four helix bundle protein, partial [Planctomycetaceae bacterium]|nr:four helix bundle protein [Planctomycetaceae bacterium]